MQLPALRNMEFVGDLTALSVPASPLPSSNSPSRAGPACSSGSLGIGSPLSGGLSRRSSAAAGAEASGGMCRSGSGSGGASAGVRVASWEPRLSVLAALPQLGGLESLVLEQWTTAFSGLGKRGDMRCL